jgi:hypothetical protein
VESIFVPADVAKILKINPSPWLGADDLAWARDKHGLFTLCSTYGFAMESTWLDTTESTSLYPHGRQREWDLIWKSDVPPKVQHS